MARGNEVVVSSEPGGKFGEGYIGAGINPKPGSAMERDASVALKGGRHTYKFATPGADGGKPKGGLWILPAQVMLGQTLNDAYAPGDRAVNIYNPLPGEELNMVVANNAGAGYAATSTLMLQNGTGKLIAESGTNVGPRFQLLEAIVTPTGDTCAWVQYLG
jgi:hypothetical protein